MHPKVAQQLLGHSKIDVTMKINTEVEDDHVREAIIALPSPADLKRAQLKVMSGQGVGKIKSPQKEGSLTA